DLPKRRMRGVRANVLHSNSQAGAVRIPYSNCRACQQVYLEKLRMQDIYLPVRRAYLPVSPLVHYKVNSMINHVLPDVPVPVDLVDVVLVHYLLSLANSLTPVSWPIHYLRSVRAQT